MLGMAHMALEILGLSTLIVIGFTGAHALVSQAIAKISTTIKNAMAAVHVKQAIAEFKANHPEIAALYDDVTGTKQTAVQTMKATPAAPVEPTLAAVSVTQPAVAPPVQPTAAPVTPAPANPAPPST